MNTTRARAGAILAGLLLIATPASACRPVVAPGDTPRAPSPAVDTPGTEWGWVIREEMARIEVIPQLPDVNGYDRSCAPGAGCAFGAAWTDDNDGPTGHDGCDERNQVLRTQLREVDFKPGNRCVVVSGILDDPYTGRTIVFEKANAARVHVDHLLPLSRAWRLGAHHWTHRQRVTFANDTSRELVATDAGANMSKSDSGLEWMPDNPAYRCEYVARYLLVSAHYRLPVTEQDRERAETVARAC